MPRLTVDLSTDFWPANEFHRIEVKLFTGNGESLVRNALVGANGSASYAPPRSVRLAEFRDLTEGTYTLYVVLLNAVLAPIAFGAVLTLLSGDRVVRVVVPRPPLVTPGFAPPGPVTRP
jgi:hypothetical protein